MKNYAITIVLFFALIYLSGPVNAQVYDDFSDKDLTKNPTWLGDDSLFQVNLNLELQSNAIPSSTGEICLAIPFVNTSNDFEWHSNYRFAFNPSSQNQFRFFLFADSLNLSKSNNALYLQFGGSTGSTDTLMLFMTQNGQRSLLARGRPSTMGKLNNTGAFKVICDSNKLFRFFLDTSLSSYFYKEFELSFIPQQGISYTGYSFKYTSANIRNFYADNFYAGPVFKDTICPFLQNTKMISADMIQLGFNERLDTNKIPVLKFNGSTGDFTSYFSDDKKALFIKLKQGLPDSIHFVELKGIYDEMGNPMRDTMVETFYHQVQKKEILITEIMFDPEPSKGLPNAEYIEIYNAGKFPVSLKDTRISDGSSTAFLPDKQFLPGEFLLLYSMTDTLLFKAYAGLPLMGFPTLNNSGDRLMFQSQDAFVIDDITYDMSWFDSGIPPAGGMSLSLLYPNQLCRGKMIWKPSLEESGGSPGFMNKGWSTAADSLAPELSFYSIPDANSILLVFNENCKGGRVKYLNNNDSLEANFVWSSTTSDSFLYSWKTMTEKENRAFVVSCFNDCSSNSKSIMGSVFYMEEKEVLQNELLITEVMFDTDFDNEFIELFNNSRHLIQTENMVIKKGNYSIRLPAFQLYPDSFLVISKSNHPTFKNIMFLSSFPSLNLSDSLFLFDNRGFRIHEFYYTTEAYHDEFKRMQKSWSIEMIDTKNPCAGINNWAASINSQNRHSAGKVNSVMSINPDIMSPTLNRVYPFSDKEILFFFNEAIDSLSIFNLNAANWDIPFFSSYHNNKTFLYKGEKSPADSSGLYRILLSGLKDCVGNNLKDTLLEFKLAQKDSSALVLNEVLFNPRVNACDFIEVFNRSESYIDLKDFYFASSETMEEDLKEITALHKLGYLMPPKSYLVFAEENLVDVYANVPQQSLLIQSIPSLPDEGIYLHLLSENGNILESVFADESLHFSSILDKEGISLERLNPYSNNTSNWVSGAASCFYSSPGRKNCMEYKELNGAESLQLESTIISPDGDGFQDFIQINYQFPSNDISLNLFIIDERGYKIKQLALSMRAGYDGFIIWDGTDEKGQIPSEGIYLVRMEYFNSKGEFLVQQKPIVVARRERVR